MLNIKLSTGRDPNSEQRYHHHHHHQQQQQQQQHHHHHHHHRNSSRTHTHHKEITAPYAFEHKQLYWIGPPPVWNWCADHSDCCDLQDAHHSMREKPIITIKRLNVPEAG
ncbi:hypothetical protein INR49_031290 [Caranx melampygus]|nr:hypothetical protein INR49_031290 [Caranx melampygus]